jgi:exodeoxyribonuclease VII small subunit
MSGKNNMTVAEKTTKLNELVAWFDGDDFSLEKALEKFSEAEKLAKEIEEDLLGLKNEIKVVKTRLGEM